MRKLRTLAIGAAAAALIVVSAAPAQAANAVLTYGSLGGNAVAVGHTIQSGLATSTIATFYSSTTGTTGIRCSVSSFVGTVTSNPAAGGVATGSLTTQTFSSCTANVVGVINVQSVTVNSLPYTVSINGATKAVTIAGAPLRSTVRLGTILGTITCVYDAVGNAIAGTASNADNSLGFVNQRLNKISGPGTCFSVAYFTAKYGPVRDTSVTGSPVVFSQ